MNFLFVVVHFVDKYEEGERERKLGMEGFELVEILKDDDDERLYS
jgi:hypothetical protein